MNELEQAWVEFQKSRGSTYGWNPKLVFQEGWRRGLDEALRVMRTEPNAHPIIRVDESHGFTEAEVKPGSHTKNCKDVICDGCASLHDCGLCGRPEFEHGDGDE